MDANQSYSRKTFTNISDSDFFVIPLISWPVYRYIVTIFGTVLTTAVTSFGVFGNIVNLIVYYKMGLQDTTTINFFVLAIIDFTVSASTFVIQISRMVVVGSIPQFAFVASFFMYPACGFGAMITALLSTERCLCIVFPLKVKTMVTSKRLTAVISTIATYQLCFFLLVVIRTGPPYNVYSPERHLYRMCYYTVPSFICFFIVLISSSFLIIRFKQTIKWRISAANKSTGESVKEEKVVRSVILICTLFIICFLPNVVIGIVPLLYSNFNMFNPYLKLLARMFYTFSFFCQAINSSANIFVYYSMSTRFREVFKEVFVPEKNYH